MFWRHFTVQVVGYFIFSFSLGALSVMGKKHRKGGGRKGKGGGVEYCQGYYDEYGMWSNGFYCPRWGGPDEQYCCGNANHRYCCQEDQPSKPVEPESVSSFIIPVYVIAGACAGVVLVIAVLLLCCFFCHCCPGFKWRKRNPRNAPAAGRTCSCGRQRPPSIATSTQPEYLACGCPIDGSGTCGSPRDARSSMSLGDSVMLTLYENPNATWQTGDGDTLPDMPFEDPPPYSERDLMKLEQELARQNRARLEEGRGRPGETGALCMTTFRPLTTPTTSTSSTSGSSSSGSHSGGHKRSDTETSKRDSGVLVEEIDSGPLNLGLEECGTTGILSMTSLDRTLSRITRTCRPQSPPTCGLEGLGHGLKIVAKSRERIDANEATRLKSSNI